MNNKENSAKTRSNKFKRILLFIGVFIIAYVLIVTAVTPKQYNLEVGQIPMQDIKAPRDTIDENATKEKEEQAILRQEYINSYKASLIGQLENTYIVRPDGTKEHLERKNKKWEN